MIFDAKILAFLALLIVQVLVSMVYKLSQTKGKYTYSPLSVIASAEFIKLCLSLTFLFYSASTDEITTTTFSFSTMIYNRLLTCYTLFQQQVKKIFILYTFGLALLYVTNNQLSFILYLYVDMASISMFKSFSSIVAAILLWGFVKRIITREQWGSIILQVVGLCIVQYDSCQNIPLLAFKHYITLSISTLITAVCSVWNERLIKTYSVNIHIQNAILYTFGLTLNLTLFFFLPDLFIKNDSKKAFFEGYSFAVLAIILCNSVLGIVITFVYKYADAIVKTFSTACATGVLLYINVAVFNIKANLTVFLGAIVIFVSSYLFLLVKPTTISPSADPSPVANNTPTEKDESKSMSKFGWKYALVGSIIGSFLLYYAISFSRTSTVFHLNDSNNMLKMSSLPIVIRIEEIHFDRPVIIHGINLCNNKSLNTTRVLINSHVCFPIEHCSDTTLSCYIQKMLDNYSFSGKVNVSLTTSAQQPSSSVTINTTISCTSSLSYWKKNDIVLVVHFNKPYYERISFLNIYRHLFPLVLFTGHEPHPDVIQCPEGPIGIKLYECLTQAVLEHPNHKGYLMIHFDLLPIFYRLENQSLTSFWISRIDCTLQATDWYWWNQDSGTKALKNVFNEIKLNIRNTTFHGRYALNYQKHARQDFCKAYSDIFYLPQQFIPDWLVLTKLFGKHGVFYEIGFSTITYMITAGNLSENLRTLTGIEFKGVSSMELLDDDPSIQYIHPVEHTLRSQKYLTETVVYRSLLTTRN